MSSTSDRSPVSTPHTAVVAAVRASGRAATAAAALTAIPAGTDLTEDDAAALVGALGLLGGAVKAVLDLLIEHLPPHDNEDKALRALGLARDSARWMVNDSCQAASFLDLPRRPDPLEARTRSTS